MLDELIYDILDRRAERACGKRMVEWISTRLNCWQDGSDSKRKFDLGRIEFQSSRPWFKSCSGVCCSPNSVNPQNVGEVKGMSW